MANSILEGPIGPTLLRLAAPMLLGVLSIVAFNLVDTYFIGQLGPDQLAAVGFTFPVVSLVGSIAQGLGIGVTSIVAASIGRGERERAAHETTDSLLLGTVLVAVVASVGLATIDPLFAALGAGADTLPYIREYMSVWYLSVAFLVIPMVGNSAIRATGDTKTPSYIMGAAVVVNVALDPLLIFGYGPVPALGLQGAAIATAVSRGITCVVALYVLRRRERLLRAPASWANFLGCARAVGNIAVPAGAARAISPLGIAALTAILAAYSAEAVAGYGVGSRVEILALTFVIALSTVMGPFVGQNYGVGQLDRIRSATRLSFTFCLGLGLAMAAALYLGAGPIANVFTDDPAVASVTVDFLTYVPVSYTLLGVSLVGATILNALQRPWPAAALAGVQMFALLVPLAYLGGEVDCVRGVLLGVSAAYLLAGATTWYWVRRELTRCEAVPASRDHATEAARNSPRPVLHGAGVALGFAVALGASACGPNPDVPARATDDAAAFDPTLSSGPAPDGASELAPDSLQGPPSLGAVGPVHASDSRQTLRSRFGAAAVVDTTLYGPTGQPQPVTVLHPGTDSTLYISFENQAAGEGVAEVVMRGPSGDYAVSGLRLGMSLGEVAAVNGKPFELSGLSFDYGGGLRDWKRGNIPPTVRGVFAQRTRRLPPPEATGDKAIASDSDVWDGLGMYLAEIRVGLVGE